MTYRRAAWVEVDLGAVQSNIRALMSRLASGVAFMAVVKANAYGHGMLAVARAALDAGADRLGVALLEEAERLRRAGIGPAPCGSLRHDDPSDAGGDIAVQVLGELPVEGALRAVAGGIDVTTGRAETIDALAAAARSLGRRARVHLKVDTGMGRIGCSPDEALPFARRISSSPDLVLAGVMTHYATSEEPAGPVFRKQQSVWSGVREAISAAAVVPEAWHSANSAATILSPEAHDDMVRCGIALYGLHPGEATKRAVELKPALSLHARVSNVKRVAAGSSVSYGHAWTAKRPTTIATLPIGYGDGYTRRLSNRAGVVVGGARAPVVGHITMDQCLIAVPDGVPIAVGDVATLIGPEVTADELASLAGTINYEITCMLNGRLPRRYLREDG